jgi:hypothetical protein
MRRKRAGIMKKKGRCNEAKKRAGAKAPALN